MSIPRVAGGDELESAGKPFLGGAPSSQRLMREPSVRVREAATEQVDQVGSKPLVFGLITNTAFVVLSFWVLTLGREENAPPRLRWWAVGFSILRLLYMARLCMDYRNQCHQHSASDGGEIPAGVYEKLIRWIISIAEIIWWIIGLYWVYTIGPDDAPHIYGLCVLFLGFEIFLCLFFLAVVLVICFCFAVAYGLVIGIAVCCLRCIVCCLRCIVGILHLVADDQKGAKDEDIEKLPKFRFGTKNGKEGVMRECDTDSPVEYVIPADDAECCICLNAYDDGAELHELPCRHHFHTACVDKWLHIKATCPLCKLNIGKYHTAGSEQV